MGDFMDQVWAMKDSVTLPAKQSKLSKTKGKPSTVVRDDDYLRLVSTVPCMYPGCGRPPPSQACHTNMGKGGAKKTSDTKSGAGCQEHHAELDQGKKFIREEKRLILANMALDTHDYLFREGKIAMVVS
jgi:hypothetical protein